MNTNQILDYLKATTNLYGIVPAEKVVEIYNQQNTDPISVDDLEEFKDAPWDYFEYYEGCFVHEAIFVDNSFYDLQSQQGNKPYYIPAKAELLKWVADGYVEKSAQLERLHSYIQKNIVHDPQKAYELTDDIQLACALDFSVDSVMAEFNRRKIVFESRSQLEELMPLIIDLANNTRIWENRGHTPNEIFTRFEKPYLKPLPAQEWPGPDASPKLRVIQGGSRGPGRNARCPCGSGKKYKNCCIDKE